MGKAKAFVVYEIAEVLGFDPEMSPPERPIEVAHWPGTDLPIEISIVEGMVPEGAPAGTTQTILASSRLTPETARHLIRGLERALRKVEQAAQRKQRAPTRAHPGG